MASPTNTAPSSPNARVILQQCLSARLMVNPATPDTPAQYVETKRGLVIYISFLKGATPDLVDKIAKAVLAIRLSTSDEGKLVSITDLPGDVLIIPQATLGGRAKGKSMQYHMNIEKETGRTLYQRFCDECQKILFQNPTYLEAGLSLKHGTYGNLQVLQLDTNGPYTHLMEF